MKLLEEIVTYKVGEVRAAKKDVPLKDLRKQLSSVEPPRGFLKSLVAAAARPAVIAELKPASPLKGALCSSFNPEELAQAYQAGGAAALSVLTERRFFQGHLNYLSRVKEAVSLPVLRKDFLIEDYQLYESRAAGADAVLLIASILNRGDLERLLRLAEELDLDALVEVHNRDELAAALECGARLIGVNNRDLHSFRVSLATTLELLPLIPEAVFSVSESGISTRREMILLGGAGAGGVLIGETLMRAPKPCRKLEELLGKVEEGRR